MRNTSAAGGTGRRRCPPWGRPSQGGRDLYRASMAVLRTHEDKSMPGAVVASLSTPWGQARDDEKSGPVGYHVVWPRDLAEIAGGLLAAGAKRGRASACCATSRPPRMATATGPRTSGSDGTKAWGSIQMGETALPVLLLNLLQREGVLAADELGRYWPMVRRGGRLHPPEPARRRRRTAGRTPGASPRSRSRS